jgi:hypothetical protein
MVAQVPDLRNVGQRQGVIQLYRIVPDDAALSSWR